MSALSRLAVEEGLASASAVEEAERHANATGEALVAALVAVAHVSPARLARALERRIVGPALVVIEPELDALREVPLEVARRRRILPLTIEVRGDARCLRVAMADPTDAAAIAELEQQTGCRVEPVLAELPPLEQATERAYRLVVTQVMERPRNVHPTIPDPAPPRTPFGGDLAVKTPHLHQPTVTTEPYHRLEDEAPVELRLRALLRVLEARGLVSSDEYLEELRKLLGERE